jgi:hypothetical protein
MTKLNPHARVSYEVYILQRARQIIEETGWIQCHLATRYGYCMLGALRMAEFGTPNIGRNPLDDTDMEKIVSRALRLPRDQKLHQWNDAIGRTKEEVLAAFDKAIGWQLAKEIGVEVL